MFIGAIVIPGIYRASVRISTFCRKMASICKSCDCLHYFLHVLFEFLVRFIPPLLLQVRIRKCLKMMIGQRLRIQNGQLTESFSRMEPAMVMQRKMESDVIIPEEESLSLGLPRKVAPINVAKVEASALTQSH